MAELVVKYTAPLPDGFTSGVLEIKRPHVYIDSQGRKGHAYQLARINPDRTLTEVQTGLPLKIIAAGQGDPVGELDWVETLEVQGLPEPLRQTARIAAVYTAPGELDLHRPSANTPLVGAPNDAVQQAEEAARQAEEARRLAEAGLSRLETAEEAARRAEAELRVAVDALRDYAMDGRLEHAIEVLPGVAENQDRIDALLAQLQSDIAQFPDLLTRQQGLEQTLGNFSGQLADAEDLFQEVKRAYQVVLDAQAELSLASRAAADARDAAQRSAQEALDSNNRAAAHAETSSSKAASAVQAADIAVAHASEAGSSAATATAERQQAQAAAGEASSQATIAREQAAASATSAGDASTAAQAAESARLEAASARDGAAQSASAALTSSQQASSSAGAAAQSASAARQSEIEANTAREQAGQSAAAALSSSQQAQAAQTAASSAAQASEQSALTASSARDGAIRVMGNPSFVQGVIGWTYSTEGTEEAVQNLSSNPELWMLIEPADAEGGRALRSLGTMTAAYRRPVPVDPARVYRLRARILTSARTAGSTSRVYTGVECLDAAGRRIEGGAGYYRYVGAVGAVPGAEWTTYQGIITGTGDGHGQFRPGTVFVRPLALLGLGSTGGDWFDLDYLYFEDITEMSQAAGSASAAAESARSAGASSTEAGQFAAASQRSSLEATAARDAAAGSAGAAQQSATASQQSAAAASSAATEAGQQAQAAQTSRVAAETARGQAQGAASEALGYRGQAADYATNAAQNAQVAANYSDAAQLAKVAAEKAQGQAQGSAAAAAQSASQASSSQTAAQQSAQASESSRVAAVAAQGAAEQASGQAAGSAAAASTQAQAAQASAGQAGQSATAAESSRQSAATAQGAAEAARNSAAVASDQAVQAQQQAASSAGTAQAQANAAQGSAAQAAGSAATARNYMTASVTAQGFQPRHRAVPPNDPMGAYWTTYVQGQTFRVAAESSGRTDAPNLSVTLPAAAVYAAVAARFRLSKKPTNATALVFGAGGGFAYLDATATLAEAPLGGWLTYTWDLMGPGVVTSGGFQPGVDPISSYRLSLYNPEAAALDYEMAWLAAGTITAEPQTSRAEFTQYVDSMKAETVLKVDSGGAVAGIGLRAESGIGSAVNILADRFVVSTAGGARQPFIVTAGQVAIDGNLIATGTFSASKITTGTLDASVVNVVKLNARNITAGLLSANRVRTGRLDSTNSTSYLDLDTGAVRFGSAEGARLTYAPAQGLQLVGSLIGKGNLQPSALSQTMYLESDYCCS